MTHECEGSCDEHGRHVGEVQKCHVFGPPPHSHGWGEFHYCETAIEIDRERGLIVLPILDSLAGCLSCGDELEHARLMCEDCDSGPFCEECYDAHIC